MKSVSLKVARVISGIDLTKRPRYQDSFQRGRWKSLHIAHDRHPCSRNGVRRTGNRSRIALGRGSIAHSARRHTLVSRDVVGKKKHTHRRRRKWARRIWMKTLVDWKSPRNRSNVRSFFACFDVFQCSGGWGWHTERGSMWWGLKEGCTTNSLKYVSKSTRGCNMPKIPRIKYRKGMGQPEQIPKVSSLQRRFHSPSYSEMQ